MPTTKPGNIVSLGRVQASNVILTQLFANAQEGKSKKIEQLFSSEISTSLNVDSHNSRGQTPLFVTCMNGHFKCAAVLLHFGANPNRRSDDGSTPTHAAAFACSTSLLQLLVRNGGDLRLHDDRDMLPRDWAIEAGHKRSKKVLELMDQWEGEVLREITSTDTNNHCATQHSTSSLTRLLRKTPDSSPGGRLVAPNTQLSQCGFGNYSSTKSPHHSEMGFTAVVPIIHPSSLTCASHGPTLTYQSPPHYIVTTGRWGSQTISMKRWRKGKRRIGRRLASSSDLLVTEININCLLRHPSILTLMGVSVHEPTDPRSNHILPQCLVFERVTLGSLFLVLHEQSCVINFTEAIHLMVQVADGLTYVHQRGLVVSNVSSHSIYLVDASTAKISDFYYAAHSGDSPPNRISHVYNRWMAPEMLAEKEPSVECDVYSFCVVVVEILSGEIPWKGFDPDSVRHQVVNRGRMMPIPDRVPSLLASIVAQGLVVSRRKRNVALHQISYNMQTLAQSSVMIGLDEHRDLHKLHAVDPPSARDTLPPPDNPDGDVGVDVPDSVPYSSTIARKGWRRDDVSSSSFYMGGNVTDHKVSLVRQMNSTIIPTHMGTPNTREPHSASNVTRSGSSRRTPMKKPSGHLSNTLYSPSKLSTLANSSAVESILRERPTNKNFMDEEVGYIHPDLMDTDSVDSSVLGFYDQNIGRTGGTKAKFNHNKSEKLSHSDSDNVLTSSELQILLGRNRNPTTRGRVGRTSPYPDLSECKSSLGEYVLSGMTSEQETPRNHPATPSASFSCLPPSYPGIIPVSAGTLDEPITPNNHGGIPHPETEKNSIILDEGGQIQTRQHRPPRPSKKAARTHSLEGPRHPTHHGHRYSRQRQGKDATKVSEKSPVVTSPVHDSVERAHTSLLELTHIIHPSEPSEPCDPGDPNYAIEPCDPNDPYHPDDANNPGDPNGHPDNPYDPGHPSTPVPSKKSLSEDGGVEVGTGTFFQEVISAAGFPHTPPTYEEEVEEAGNKGISRDDPPTPVDDVVIDEPVVEPAPQGGATRRRRRRGAKFPPVEWKSCCTDVARRRGVGGNVEVLFSNFPSCTTVDASCGGGLVAQGARDARDAQEEHDAREARDALEEHKEWDAQHAREEHDAQHAQNARDEQDTTDPSPHPTIAPYPSAFSSDKSSKPADLEELFAQFAQRNTHPPNTHPHDTHPPNTHPPERRFSINSDDLEDIFAEFADRQRFYKMEDVGVDVTDGGLGNPLEPPASLKNGKEEDIGVDVADGGDMVPGNPPEPPGNNGKILVSTSSQTSSEKFHPKVIGHQRASAISPPSIAEFIIRAGGWGVRCSATQTEVAMGGREQWEEESSPHFQTCLEPPGGNEEPINSSQSINLTDVTHMTQEDRRRRAVIPASRMLPSSIPLEGVLSPRYLTRSSSDLHYLHRSQSARESQHSRGNPLTPHNPPPPMHKTVDDNALNTTPSKWSFHHKLSLFEDIAGNAPQFMGSMGHGGVGKRGSGGGALGVTSGPSSGKMLTSAVDEGLNATPTNPADPPNPPANPTTPANPTHLLKLTHEKGVKTSTPVVHTSSILALKPGGLNESYSPNPPDIGPMGNPSSFNNSSIMQMSGIPRCHGFPDVSTESNATFAEKSSLGGTPGCDHYLTADNKMISHHLGASPVDEGEVSSEEGSSDGGIPGDSELHRGISELSTALASEVLMSHVTNMTSHDPNVTEMTSHDPHVTEMTSHDPHVTNMTSHDPHVTELTSHDPHVTELTSHDPHVIEMTSHDPHVTNMTPHDPQSDSSCDISGISYDEDEEGGSSPLQPPPRSADTSVWMDSQTSTTKPTITPHIPPKDA